MVKRLERLLKELLIGFNFGNNMALPSLKGIGLPQIGGMKTTTEQALQPSRISVGDILSQIPAAIESSIEQRKLIPKFFRGTAEKITKFLTPESPEEGIKQGLFPIRRKDGTYSYVDMFPIMGLGIVGKKAVTKVVETSVKKVISALKEAKSLRAVQETLFTKARGEKFAKALAVGKKVTGEAGFIAEKAQLKGALPRVEFEAIRSKIGQADIDSLFMQVKDSVLLSEWDKLPAREGLAKLFGEYGGKVPTEGEISLLNKVFGSEFTETLLAKRPLWDKIKEAGLQLVNIPRSIMSSFDLSAPFRQGAFLIGRPKQFFPAFKRMFGAFASETSFKNIQEEIARKPTFDLMKNAKLALTEMDVGLKLREERFMSQWAEKIPVLGKGIRASGRAYVGFLNKLRADVFEDLVKKATNLGLDPHKNLDLAREIAEFVNNATGRGSLGAFEKSAQGLNTFFFSPRLMASRLNLINPATYIKASPFVRKEALKSLFSFVGTGMTVLGLANLAGAKVGDEPRSADFGKIKIGDTRIDIWAGFQQYIRLAGQLISGEVVSSTTGKVMTLGEGFRPLTRLDILQRFAEYKEAPIFSFLTSLLKGQDFKGQPIDIPEEVKKRFIPMALQDVVDISEDDPDLLPLSALGIFGVGLQTYKQQAKTPSGFPSLKTGKTQLPSLKGVGTLK